MAGKRKPGKVRELAKRVSGKGERLGFRKLSYKIASGYLVIVLLVAVLGVVTYQKLTNIIASYENVVNTNYPYIIAIKEIDAAISTQQAALGQYLLTENPEALVILQLRQAEVKQKVEKAREYTTDTKQHEILDKILAFQEDVIKTTQDIITLVESGDKETALALYKDGKLSNELWALRSYYTLLNGVNEEAIKKTRATVRAEALQATQSFFLGGVLVLTISLFAILYIPRSISRPLVELTKVSQEIAAGNLTREPQLKSRDEVGTLAAAFTEMVHRLRELVLQIRQNAAKTNEFARDFSNSADETSKAAEQIAMTVQEVAQGMENQVQQVESVSQVINDLAAAVQQIATNANNVSQDASAAQHLAQAGSQTAAKTVAQIETANQSVQQATAMMRELGERSQEIGNIVDVITGIADQTNLLALNAAIEAARAGEQGRGFAVVADEVRKLAEQSARAAKQIGDLISQTQADIAKAIAVMKEGANELDAGTSQVQAVGSSFQEILTAVERVASQIQEVSSATQEIAAGSERVANTMKEFSRISREVAAGTQNISAATEEQTATMEEIAAAANQLKEMAGELERLLTRFTL